MSETISGLRKLVKESDVDLQKYSRQESKARAKWRKLHGRYIQASEYLASVTLLKQIKSRKRQRESEIVKDYKRKSIKLTQERDAARARIAEIKEEKKFKYELKLAQLVEQARSAKREEDEVVEQVFFLNEGVTRSLQALSVYLTGRVYKQLIGPDNKLRSQITFTHSDGKRRVQAMVNAIQKIESYMAVEARSLINQFFDRVRPAAEVNENMTALFDLTQKILYEKNQFRIGPELYVFLGLDLDNKVFPELAQAQLILRKSLRSERTSKYVRLYEREGPEGRWRQTKQS